MDHRLSISDRFSNRQICRRSSREDSINDLRDTLQACPTIPIESIPLFSIRSNPISNRMTVSRSNASSPKLLLPVSFAAYRTPIAHDPGALGYHLNERTSRFKPSLPTSCTYSALIYVNIRICVSTYIHIYIQIYP